MATKFKSHYCETEAEHAKQRQYLRSFYSDFQKQDLTDRQLFVTVEIVAAMNQSWLNRLKITPQAAKHVGTSLQTLRTCAPREWYRYAHEQDAEPCAIELPDILCRR